MKDKKGRSHEVAISLTVVLKTERQLCPHALAGHQLEPCPVLNEENIRKKNPKKTKHTSKNKSSQIFSTEQYHLQDGFLTTVQEACKESAADMQGYPQAELENAGLVSLSGIYKND